MTDSDKTRPEVDPELLAFMVRFNEAFKPVLDALAEAARKLNETFKPIIEAGHLTECRNCQHARMLHAAAGCAARYGRCGCISFLAPEVRP